MVRTLDNSRDSPGDFVIGDDLTVNDDIFAAGNIEITDSSKTYKINGNTVLSNTALGSNITSSSLTSVATLNQLTVDNLRLDGNNIGLTSDTDLIQMSDNTMRVNGALGIGTSPDTNALLHLAGNDTINNRPQLYIENTNTSSDADADAGITILARENGESRLQLINLDASVYTSFLLQYNGGTDVLEMRYGTITDPLVNNLPSDTAFSINPSNGHFNLASGKVLQIDSTTVLSSSTLGTNVVNSSLQNVGTLTDLTVDNVQIDGSNIGLTTDTDLMTLANNELTVNGSVDAGVDYQINGVSVLNSTTLGTNIVNSSLQNVGTLTSLTVDNVRVDGSNIGLTTDTDLMTLASNLLTVNGDFTTTGTIEANKVEGLVSTIGNVGIASENSDDSEFRIGMSANTGGVDGNQLYRVGLMARGKNSTAYLPMIDIEVWEGGGGNEDHNDMRFYLKDGVAGSIEERMRLTYTAMQMRGDINIISTSNDYTINNTSVLNATTLGSGVVNSSLTSLGAQAENLDMDTNKIVNLVDPTNAQDAATKNYVDSAITSTTSTSFTPTFGSLLTDFTLSTATGTYYEVGELRFYYIKIVWTDKNSAGATEAIYLQDLPTIGTSNNQSIGLFLCDGIGSNSEVISFQFGNTSVTTAALQKYDSSARNMVILQAQDLDATGEFTLSGSIRIT